MRKFKVTDLQTNEESIVDVTDLLAWANDIFWDDEDIDFTEFSTEAICIEKAIEALFVSEYLTEEIR